MTISLRAATGSFLAAMAILLAAPAAAQFGGPVPVRVAEAQTTTMSPTMQVAGTVISRADATLSAEVEGRLLEVAEVGTRVEEGDVLARIEDTRLKLEAQELAAEIQRAESRLEFLDAELARYRRLAERNLTAVTQIEQTRADRNVAASELEVARSRLAQVQDRIDRTRVRAPFPGVVVARLVQAGERVAVGADVVRLVDQDRLEVVARAPLAFYRYVAPGDELAIRVAEDWFIPAEVRTAVSVGDESSHVFELRLDVDERLPVGQTVRVTIPTASARDVLAVPRDALVLRGDGVAVFVVDEQGKAQRMRVEPGIGSEEWIEVSGPVQAGDRVVVRGNERLRAGQDVQVQEG